MRLILFLLVSVFSIKLTAQADRSISVSVLRPLFYTYELNYEFSYSSDPKRKIVLTPIVQYGRFNKLGQYNGLVITSNQSDVKKGLGLRVGHKFYLRKLDRIDEIHFPYLSIDLEYTRTHINYKGTATVGSQEVDECVTMKFHNWGSRLLIGDQIVKNDKLVIDFFVGVDFTHLVFIQNLKGNLVRDYDSNIFGPIRQGLRPTLGLKIGVSL